MEKTSKILRRSVHTFLQNYHFFTSTAALLALPFSVSILLSQSLPPASSSSSSLLPTIHVRLRAIFDAAGFPSSSQFFSILCLKLSQTISSFSFTLPCSLTFLLISKSCVILSLSQHKLPLHSLPFSLSSFLQTYRSLLLTYVCNSLVIISANATAFTILFFTFNCLEGMRFESSAFTILLSAFGAILYSVILAHALIVCNFALVLSGTEKSGGFEAILKACVLIRESIPLALSLAIPLNLGSAAIEALFQYRVVRAYRVAKGPSFTVAMEGLFIAYLYSILIVLDTVVSCIFFKSCMQSNCRSYHEDVYSCTTEIPEDDPGRVQKSEC